MKNQLLINTDELFSLSIDNDKLVLDIVIGGVGMYEIEHILTDKEKASYEMRGENFIKQLVDKIRKTT